MAGMGGFPQAEFVSEPIEPDRFSGDLSAMARGEPGLPASFRWRQARYEVAQLTGKWKTSSRDRGELYLRRHWYEIVTTSGERMTLYCDRQAQNRAKPKARWWIYSLQRARPGDAAASP